MITKIAYRTALACAILTSASPSLAQDGPSYDETVNYIVTRTNVSGATLGHRWTQSVNFAEHCRIRVDLNIDYIDTKYASEARSHWANLDAFDPKEVWSRIDYSDIILTTTESIDLIKTRTTSGSNVFEHRLFVKVPNGVERVGRALQHLIILCGGQEELF